MKAILNIGNSCNNKCLFCRSSGSDQSINSGFDEFEKRIKRFKNNFFSTVILSGGEPTIHPDFFVIASSIIKNEMKPGLFTNGRMFAYSNFARQYAALNPACTQVMLFSDDKSIHDKLAGTNGAFVQTVKGLKNLSSTAGELTISVPVNNLNIENIKEISDIAAGIGLKPRIKFCLSPSGKAGQDDTSSTTDIEKAAASVSDAISYGMRRYFSAGFRFCWEGFAPCHIPVYSDLCTEPLSEDIVAEWPLNDNDFHRPETNNSKDPHNPECLECSMGYRCFSKHREIRCPIIERIPNGVSYQFERSIATESVHGCPAGEKVCESVHPFNEVALLFDGEVKIYSNEEKDSSRVLEKIKFVKEQLYLNITDETLNLDFRKAYRRLTLHDDCKACTLMRTRSGIYTLREGNAFAEIESTEKEWIERLDGRILDIGCGQPLFPGLIRKKIDRGEIEYLGIDVSPPDIDGLSFESVSFEDFCWRGEPFDHIIMLRSYNHFKHPLEVLRKAASLLKPGGHMHIFENAIFAILKKDKLEKRLPSDKPRYQHYRNHFSEDVIHLIDFINDIEIVEHKPVTQSNANQWFLTLRKIV